QKVTDISEAICKLERCSNLSASNLAKWVRNKAVNTGFENQDPGDASMPVFWTRTPATIPAAVYRDDTDSALGDWSVRIAGSGAGNQGLEQQLLKYEPLTSYGIKLRAKVNTGSSLTADVYDYTANTQLGSVLITGTNWTVYTFGASTPAAANHDIRIRIYSSGSGFVDEVSMLPQHYNSSIPNGSFETPDQFDPALPRFWSRGASTTAANVVADSSQSVSGLRSLMLNTAASGGQPQERFYNWKGYKQNGAYELTVTARTNNSAAGGRISIIDTTTNTTLASTTATTSSWTTSTVSFTAPSDYNHVLKVVIGHDNPSIPGGALWVDDLAVTLQ
ncbi:MAG: hypothetical protein K0R67_756, partial [Paenibacillus sp.]|nr:hypothetical protein [Paenibacillus sp.]